MTPQIRCGFLNTLGVPCTNAAALVIILADRITAVPCCASCAEALPAAQTLPLLPVEPVEV